MPTQKLDGSSDEAVLTIGRFHGGEVGNVIPDSGELTGTIRTYDELIRVFLKLRLTKNAQGIAAPSVLPQLLPLEAVAPH